MRVVRKPDRRHRAFGFADLHELAGAQGLGVHEHQAADGLVDDAGRADRQHQADEHADALEGLAVAAWNVGIRGDQREQPDDGDQQPPRGTRSRFVDPPDVDAACLHSVEEGADHAHDEAREEENQRHEEQSWYRMQDAAGEAAEAAEQVVEQFLAPGARVGEELQHQCRPLVHEQQRDSPGEEPDGNDGEVGEARASDDVLAPARRELRRPTLHGRAHAARKESECADDQPEQCRQRQAGQRACSRPPQHRGGVAALANLVERELQVACRGVGRHLRGLAGLTIHVRVQDAENELAVDLQRNALRYGVRRDDERPAVFERRVEAIARWLRRVRPGSRRRPGRAAS